MTEQRTDEWFAERAGKVTASRINDVMMAKTTAGYQNYRAQLVCERLTGEAVEGFTSAAMQHGTDTEPQARAFYELEVGQPVAEVGFVRHATIQMAGASPDGLVGELGLVEIKCPQPAEHIRLLSGGSIKKQYDLQMHWQMICTGREWCDFVSFCPTFPAEMQMHIQRVKYDAEKEQEITAAVVQFLAEVDALTADLQRKYREAA